MPIIKPQISEPTILGSLLKPRKLESMNKSTFTVSGGKSVNISGIEQLFFWETSVLIIKCNEFLVLLIIMLGNATNIKIIIQRVILRKPLDLRQNHCSDRYWCTFS